MTAYVVDALDANSAGWRDRRAERPPPLSGLAAQAEGLDAAAEEASGGQFVRGLPQVQFRSEARRDRDRVLYSPTFARLSGVTQVITPSPTGRLTHSRLTHSLKVAQVARAIAEQLMKEEEKAERLKHHGGADPDVAEAAALAHDIGHPPFGHAGEKVLDAYAKEIGLPQGFEGNAQSFRIVSLLEVHDLDGAGLSLTAASLAGILKYPWSRARVNDDFPLGRDQFDLPISELRKEKFSFYSDLDQPEGYAYAAYQRAMSVVPRDEHGRPVQSVEASIMDVADDITYALHDLDDFYRSGFIRKSDMCEVLDDWEPDAPGSDSDGGAEQATPRPGKVLDDLALRLHRSYPTRFDKEKMRLAVCAIWDQLTSLADHFDDSREQSVRAQNMVSYAITGFLNRIVIATEASWNRPIVSLESHDWHAVEILKALTRHCVINRPSLAAVQRGQEELLRRLLRSTMKWAKSEPRRRLPARLGGYIEIAEEVGYSPADAKKRGVIDYAASLSDLQAMELARVLSGGHVDLSGGVL